MKKSWPNCSGSAITICSSASISISSTPFPAAAYAEIPDDTLICRCEDVSMGDIRRAVANGYDTPATLKIALRSAMGDCQGRICGPVIYDILAALTGRSQGSMTPLVVRPPVKPVSIDSLASFSE